MFIGWKTSMRRWASPSPLLIGLVAVCLLFWTAEASLGDRLPEFRECVEVCERANCDPANDPTYIRAWNILSRARSTTIQAALLTSSLPILALHHRLLFWTCPKECDYTCQHIITSRRIAAGQPVTQFHGKWPFVRVLGIQEPFSVIFSIGNFLAHQTGLWKLRERVPAGSPMRSYYELFAYFGMLSWVFSTIFHTRDFRVTEQLDYFGAGASVLYGMYYSLVRVARLDLPTPRRRSVLRFWTGLCCALFVAHVAYLKLWSWDYQYNMAANVVVGMVHNLLWTYFSYVRWRQTRQGWTIWPGLLVAWIMLMMSLELLDFPPLWGALDAHSLWHLGTIWPTVFWYDFMVKDSQDLAKRDKYQFKGKWNNN